MTLDISLVSDIHSENAIENPRGRLSVGMIHMTGCLYKALHVQPTVLIGCMGRAVMIFVVTQQILLLYKR